MKYKVILIPADETEPVEILEHDPRNGYGDLIFGNSERGTVGISTFRSVKALLAYNDEGLASSAPVVNVRAMILWADMAGRPLRDFAVPLVGTYVLAGVDPEGEYADVPQGAIDGLPPQWLNPKGE